MLSTQDVWTLLLLPAGFLAGIINVLAGGGSFLTLPVLICAGLPVHVANGTNRISVVVQGLLVTAAYRRSQEFDAALYKKQLPPLLLGAIVGAYLATVIDPSRLRTAFGAAFLAMGLFMLRVQKADPSAERRASPLRYPALFAVGIYGGFIQAGVGLWILLTSTSLFGIDALRANTVKLPLTLTFTVPALIIFLQADLVQWVPGLVLALGTALGNAVGVKLSLKGGADLILRAVTVVLFATGLHLLLT